MIYPVRVSVVVLALVTAFVPTPAGWVERVYSRGIYPRLQPVLTRASNSVPFACLDVAVAGLIIYLLRAFWRDHRRAGARAALAGGAVRLLIVIAAIYLGFIATWGLNYRRVPLEAKLRFDPTRVTSASARTLAAMAVERVNAGHAEAHASPFQAHALERAFAETQRLLGAAHLAAVGRPKPSLATWYFRRAAIDGMTVPVFLEIIVNPDVLPVERPTVLAHDWAHLAGYADESEANFVAWVSALRSQDAAARYSAWLDAYRLAAGVLPRAERATLPALDAGPRQDLRDIAARYARASPVVRAAARGVYDSYLRANRIDEGIANYDLVLRLVLGSEFEGNWEPRLK